jgi:aminoglycoside 6'-N-acetyltransferase I
MRIMTHVRPVRREDASAWLQMRQALWPDDTGSHAVEIRDFFAGRRKMPLEVLIAFEGDTPVGFAELSIRPYAEGCETDRVAYLEGWYVLPEHRRRGIGRALVRAAEAWGRTQRCTEFASDTNIENHTSAGAHRALGFDEVEQIRCFRKVL